MKIIVTENQFKLLQENDKDFNKTKSLVISMFNQGHSVNDIKKYTGLSNEVVVLCLEDEKTIKKGDCEDIYETLYNILWETDFIEKDVTYNDGSTLSIDYDRFEGSITLSYTSDNGIELGGYATFLWNGECNLPIDVNSVLKNGTIDWYEASNYNVWRADETFKEIETYRQLIDYFNQTYFKVMKEPLDEMVEEYLYHFYSSYEDTEFDED